MIKVVWKIINLSLRLIKNLVVKVRAKKWSLRYSGKVTILPLLPLLLPLNLPLLPILPPLIFTSFEMFSPLALLVKRFNFFLNVSLRQLSIMLLR